MKLTEAQREALDFCKDGMMWEMDCDPQFIGTNNLGRHYASRHAVDLFADGLLDGKGRITDLGRAALGAEEKANYSGSEG